MALFERSEKAPVKELERFVRRVRALQAQVSNPYAFTRVLGEVLIKQTRKRFETKTSPAEVAWKPWSTDYGARRGGSDSLLVDNSTHGTGPHLRDSFHAQTKTAGLVVSTDVPYADPNQRTRPFIGISRSDLSELEKAMEGVLESMLT